MSVTMKLSYKGELHCELSHGPSKTVIETDAPLDNMGKGESFSPTDLVGAALVSCAVTTMAIKAPKEGIPFGNVSGRVVKDMSTEQPRRIAKLAIELDMPGGLSPEQRVRLEEIARTCPVALSLSKELELPIRFNYPGA
jgi:uncharacterized OsmC-like protein